MARVDLHGITKDYGRVSAARDVTLSIDDGEFLVLLGPSGCGKTTTLRMMAGFIEPTRGTIEISGRDVTFTPPWRRNTGMVFQGYALFPNMTVGENVMFGLKMRKVGKSERMSIAIETLKKVRLETYADRYPRELSGGQQQRVALARALAIQPDVLLLDEPLSNLDAKLREEVRVEIKQLQQRLGITTVMVTHDQDEALALADRLAVMANGTVRQIGNQRDLYEAPRDRFVAEFIGRSSSVSGKFVDATTFEGAAGALIKCRAPDLTGPGTLSLRPESIQINPAPGTEGLSGFPCEGGGLNIRPPWPW